MLAVHHLIVLAHNCLSSLSSSVTVKVFWEDTRVHVAVRFDKWGNETRR